MASFDETLNFAIPAILILIAIGFIYIKFLQPFVIPMLSRFWEWAKGNAEPVQTIGHNKREITYE